MAQSKLLVLVLSWVAMQGHLARSQSDCIAANLTRSYQSTCLSDLCVHNDRVEHWRTDEFSVRFVGHHRVKKNAVTCTRLTIVWNATMISKRGNPQRPAKTH